MVQAAAAQMFEEQDTGYVRAIRDVLLFLPFATLAKAMQDLGEASDNDSDTGNARVHECDCDCDSDRWMRATVI